MRHKHADLIHAWADGAEIELYDGFVGKWLLSPTPRWYDDYKYRIKPEKKPDVVQYLRAYKHGEIEACSRKDGCIFDNLKCTFDGETGKLKSAEVLNANS